MEFRAISTVDPAALNGRFGTTLSNQQNGPNHCHGICILFRVLWAPESLCAMRFAELPDKQTKWKGTFREGGHNSSFAKTFPFSMKVITSTGKCNFHFQKLHPKLYDGKALSHLFLFATIEFKRENNFRSCTRTVKQNEFFTVAPMALYVK